MIPDKFLYDWLAVVAIGFFVVITPGPNMAIVVRNSIAHTRSAGVYTATGLVLGNLVHITYCLVGIGVIISKSILLFTLIKLAGAAYLIFLGMKSLRMKSYSITHQPDAIVPLNAVSALRTGFFTDLLNPKATLFFLSLFTQIVHPATPLSAQIFYATTIVVLEFCFLATLALAISHHSVRRRLEAASRWVELATGAVLIALGLRVAAARFTQ